MARKIDMPAAPPADPEFINQAGFARMHQVTRKSVTKWKSRGLVVVTADGRVDVAKSNALLAQRPAVYRGGVTGGHGPKGPSKPAVSASDSRKGNAGKSAGAQRVSKGNKKAAARKKGDDEAGNIQAPPMAPADPNPELGYTVNDALRVKENYLALQRKLEFELASGKLVEIEVVGAEFDRIVLVIRERLLTLPGKLADQCVGRDRAAIEDLLRAEITEALNELHQPDTYGGAPASVEGEIPPVSTPVSTAADDELGRMGRHLSPGLEPNVGHAGSVEDQHSAGSLRPHEGGD